MRKGVKYSDKFAEFLRLLLVTHMDKDFFSAADPSNICNYFRCFLFSDKGGQMPHHPRLSHK